MIDLGIGVDNMEILYEKIENTLLEADILITSGGVSMGELDLLKPILESLGIMQLVWYLLFRDDSFWSSVNEAWKAVHFCNLRI